MKMQIKGRWQIELINALTGEIIEVIKLHNLLMAINQSARAQMLMGTYTGGNDALAIKYFAVGTDDTPATINDTQLGAEVYRKQVTQITNPEAGIVQSVVSFGSQEANYNIKEIGVFCGPSATSTADTGTLLSRIVVDIKKNTNIVCNLVRQDICELV